MVYIIVRVEARASILLSFKPNKMRSFLGVSVEKYIIFFGAVGGGVSVGSIALLLYSRGVIPFGVFIGVVIFAFLIFLIFITRLVIRLRSEGPGAGEGWPNSTREKTKNFILGLSHHGAYARLMSHLRDFQDKAQEISQKIYNGEQVTLREMALFSNRREELLGAIEAHTSKVVSAGNEKGLFQLQSTEASGGREF